LTSSANKSPSKPRANLPSSKVNEVSKWSVTQNTTKADSSNPEKVLTKETTDHNNQKDALLKRNKDFLLQKQEKIQRLKNKIQMEKQQEIEKECTFKPKINKQSRSKRREV